MGESIPKDRNDKAISDEANNHEERKYLPMLCPNKPRGNRIHVDRSAFLPRSINRSAALTSTGI